MIITSHIQRVNFIVLPDESPWESAALGNCKHIVKRANGSHNLQVSAVSEQQHSPATVFSHLQTKWVQTGLSKFISFQGTNESGV